ncbi:TetR family transcriptional regulator [Actinoplanes cyaneus]|uniref:TetR family transcriptional regulator n=1 Tax=Actinoplanes cyaneus TaxID=52696 RepID=A0A919IDB1_9ACTN|nr:TetR/AcrR family transcriptional regulator [Actinoplanes cyaneus]MCW2142745.1 transcriptional regulator, TetR family [Actinoplanes cyaneus]GID62297.1 TetR family transcriptional regulator [Actinoplanes cyaneus]
MTRTDEIETSGARKVTIVSTTTDPGATGPRARNRRGEGGRLRAEIVTAAAELLDESGNEQAVTLRAVARRIGISAPSIYAHFPDRQAILLAVVQDAFAELTEALRATTGTGNGTDSTGEGAVAGLRAACTAYLDFAATRPQRYRVMFGGLWNGGVAVDDAAVSAAEVTELGQEALAVLVDALDACVAAGGSASTDTPADAIALWLGLHGLAHQRSVAPAFPWPADIAERLIASLARLTR